MKAYKATASLEELSNPNVMVMAKAKVAFSHLSYSCLAQTIKRRTIARREEST